MPGFVPDWGTQLRLPLVVLSACISPASCREWAQGVSPEKQ